MTPHTALLAAIRATPAADAPRLALADALAASRHEADRLRAAFVRLQCELAKLPADDPRLAPLTRHCRALEAQGRPAWLGDLPACGRRAAFTRGFVEHLDLTGREFVRHVEAISQREPVWSVAVHDPGADAALASPLIGGLGRVVRIEPPEPVILKFPRSQEMLAADERR